MVLNGPFTSLSLDTGELYTEASGGRIIGGAAPGDAERPHRFPCVRGQV